MEEVIGKELLDSSANIIGRVKDIEVNDLTNEMEALVVSKGGISESLGLSGNDILIPIGSVKEIGDKILLKDRMEYEV